MVENTRKLDNEMEGPIVKEIVRSGAIVFWCARDVQGLLRIRMHLPEHMVDGLWLRSLIQKDLVGWMRMRHIMELNEVTVMNGGHPFRPETYYELTITEKPPDEQEPGAPENISIDRIAILKKWIEILANVAITVNAMACILWAMKGGYRWVAGSLAMMIIAFLSEYGRGRRGTEE